MTDTNYASELIQETFEPNASSVKDALSRAFRALKRHEIGLPAGLRQDRPRQWTERRVRSLWFKEARRVDHYEIEDLTAVAVEEARIERLRLSARENRLAAIIAAADAGKIGELYQLKSGPSGRLDMPGAGHPLRRSTDK